MKQAHEQNRKDAQQQQQQGNLGQKEAQQQQRNESKLAEMGERSKSQDENRKR